MLRPAERGYRFLVPPLAVVVVLLLDLLQDANAWPVPVVGLLDEPAHLLTAWLCLLALPTRVSDRIAWRWALLGSVAIDLDHIPLFLGVPGMAAAGGRPITHSLAGLAVLVVLAAASTRSARVHGAMLGLAVGVVLHFLRDLATGPGVQLFWPAGGAVLLPYRVEVALLVALAALATMRRRGVPGPGARGPGAPGPGSTRRRDTPAGFRVPADRGVNGGASG